MKPRSKQSTTLKRKPVFQSGILKLCQITRTQTTYPLLASLDNFKEGGARLLRDSECIDLNVFNRLLSIQIMGLIGTKAILH